MGCQGQLLRLSSAHPITLSCSPNYPACHFELSESGLPGPDNGVSGVIVVLSGFRLLVGSIHLGLFAGGRIIGVYLAIIDVPFFIYRGSNIRSVYRVVNFESIYRGSIFLG